MNTMQSLFNLIRINASQTYKDTVPALKDKSPIGDAMTPILSDLAIYKEFTSLLGAWMKDEVFQEAWNHPVIQDIVKNGNGMPTGNYTREIVNNPINPVKYDPAHPEKVLEQKFTNDLVNFYIRNVYDKFKVSFPYQEIQEAFTTYDGAQQYVAMKKASLESGGNFATFNHLKECWYANRQNGGITVKELPASVEEMTEAQWLEVGSELEAFSKSFPFLNTDYIAYNNMSDKVEDFYGFAKKEDIRIIATIDFITKYGYKALANMFNLTIGELKDRVHEIDTFDYPIYNKVSGQIVGTQHSDVKCILCDIRGLKASIDMEMDDSFFNKDTLVTTMIKHKWQTFAMSPFNKCIMFVDPFVTPSNYVVEQNGEIVRDGTVSRLTFNRSLPNTNFNHYIGFDNIKIYSGSIDITDNLTNGESKLDVATTGSVITDSDMILALINYAMNTELKAQYTDADGIVRTTVFDFEGLAQNIGSFDKNTPILITRKDNRDLTALDSYTYGGDKTFTIEPSALAETLETYPNIYMVYSLIVSQTSSAASAMTGSPITIKASPLPNTKW